jgi:predicted dehydrogenase
VDCYAAALDDFARAVLAGRAAPAAGRDARAILAIVLGLYESSATGRVVRLDHDLEVNHARA